MKQNKIKLNDFVLMWAHQLMTAYELDLIDAQHVVQQAINEYDLNKLMFSHKKGIVLYGTN